MKRSSRPAAARTSSLAVIGALVVLASCAPPPTTFNFGPLTVPLPPIGATAAPVEYVIDIPGIPSVELTPYIPPQELTPYIPPQQLTPYIPPVCVPFVGCSPEVPATYSPAVPATYSPAIPATYSPEIPGGSCSAGYTPPSFLVEGATAALPQLSIDTTTSTITIPNVTVNVPAVDLILGSASVGCAIANLPAVNLSTGDVKLSFPSQAAVQQATLNLATGLLTFADPSITLTGLQLQFLGLDATFDLPDITVPLPTITVPVT